MRPLPAARLLCITVFAFAAFSTPLAPAAYAQGKDPRFESDHAAVAFTFARYRNAVMTRDGATAFDCVDSNTRAYYDRLIDLIKFGEPEELREQTYTDLTIVLSSRQFIDSDTLLAMDGRDLFVNAVDKGWTDRELIAAGLGPITIEDDTALSTATISNMHTLFHWIFRFEDERWRLDLATQLAAIDDGIKAMLAAEGLNPSDLAYTMLLRGAGADAVTEEVWQPLAKR